MKKLPKKLLLLLFILVLTVFGLVANHQLPPDTPGGTPAGNGPAIFAPGKSGGKTAASPQQSSGKEEQSGSLLPAPITGDFADKLRVSELMVKNKAAVLDPSGTFSDWVELENISVESVSLVGWGLSDQAGSARWTFSEGEIRPGERLVVFFDGEGGPAFSLSRDETLYLLSPDGETRDEVFCFADKADCSLIRQEEGGFAETPWISPGLENGPAGYEAWCAGRSAGESLVIYEVMVYNKGFTPPGMSEPCDCVEIKNVSASAVSLAGCSLSDKSGEPRWSFPADRSLAPGEILLVCCHNDEEGSIGSALNTGFDLSADRDQLFLRDSSGKLLDWVALHDVPLGGSLGRMDGQPGFFYFAQRSPGENNSEGQRRITDMPATAEPDGVYDGVDSVTVVLRSPGEIHYTTDGSVPTLNSPLYSEPLSLNKTTVVRAVAKESSALLSPVATYSYIINENHSLPVLSLVVDDPATFNYIWNSKVKHYEIRSNLALYDGEHSFNQTCGTSMKGYTSLDLPKKSLGVSFKGRYGGKLDCDVFGNGITEYSSLAIRAGQDYTFSVFRNELFQQLCLEAGDDCLTQESKYCILYLNGQYYGIYCLKEDFSRQYYASHAGVSKDSVVANKCPVGLDSEFYHEVLNFIYHNDLTVDENYQYVCDHVNIDSLIDWFLLESYCANTDIQGNTRMYRSPENGDRWTFCFYDLDWGFWYSKSDFTIIMNEIGNAGNQMPPLVKKLLKNRYFRDKVLYRFAELNRTVLSNEHVLQLIDEYQELLEPEMKRERQRWNLKLDQWYVRVDELRKFINDNNWEQHNVNQICMFLNVGPMEREQIFGR